MKHISQRGVGIITKQGSFALLQRRASAITKWDRQFIQSGADIEKVGATLLQSGSIFTKYGSQLNELKT